MRNPRLEIDDRGRRSRGIHGLGKVRNDHNSREGRKIPNSVVMRLLGALRPYGQSLGVGHLGDHRDNSFPHWPGENVGKRKKKRERAV